MPISLSTSANVGLAEVYGIIKQVDGETGTTVRIMLPIAADEVTAETEQPGKTVEMAEQASEERTVLVVEDELPLRRFAVRALGKRGYRVLEAENGDVALELLDDDDTAIDLVLSDVMMPGIDGATLLRKIRTRRPNARIIMISGYGESILGGLLDQRDGVLFLPKPFSLNELLEKVDEAFV